ncbi:MAG: hypothetical protein KME06_22405 [Kastovskya adunca ATA6-11-RM4]|jgi:MFS family permease|nr:hypothetical protein [Kastovskya adunca ATA6-11-RM4]
MERRKYKLHTRKKQTKKRKKWLGRVLGLVQGPGPMLVMSLVSGLVAELVQKQGLVQGWAVLVAGLVAGWVAGLVAGLVQEFLLDKKSAKRKKSRRDIGYAITAKLARLLPEEFRADLNTVFYRLIKQKHPQWLIRVRITICLLNMFRGWIQVKLQNIWFSMNLRL